MLYSMHFSHFHVLGHLLIKICLKLFADSPKRNYQKFRVRIPIVERYHRGIKISINSPEAFDLIENFFFKLFHWL